MGSQRVGHDCVTEVRTPACQGARGSLLRQKRYRKAQTPRSVPQSPRALGPCCSPFVNPELPLLASVGNNGKQLEKTATDPTPHLFFCPVSEKSQDSDNFVEAN